MFSSIRFLKVAVLLLCCNYANAQTVYSNGKLDASNSTNTHIVKMLKDASDYNYIVGTFTDSLHLDLAGGYTVFGNPFKKHGFVAKYDPSGAIQWGFAIGGVSDSLIIMDINIDYNGDVLIGGSFYGTADFDPLGAPTNLTATVGADGFFAKYNPSGNLIFVNQIETAGSVGAVSSIFTDGGAYIFIGGYFDVSVDVDHTGATVILNAQAGIDGYAATYDPGGVTFLDSISFRGSGNEYVTDITDMNFGSWILVSGYFDANIEMNAAGPSTILNTNGLKDIFIGRYNSGFDYQLAHNIGGPGNDIPRDVYGNPFDLVLLAEYENTVDFNSATIPAINLTSTGLRDIVVVKYDFSYWSLFAKSFGNSGANSATFMVKETTFGGAKSISDVFTFAFNFTGTIDLNPDAGVVSVSSSNTPVNSAMVSLYGDGSYQSNFVIQSKSIDGMTFSGNNVRDVSLVGNFSGTGVDVMPYNGSVNLTHSVNDAGFFNFYNRCAITVDGSTLGTYECETSTAVLTCTTTDAVGAVEYNWSNGDYYEYGQTSGGALADNSNYYTITATDDAGCDAMDSVWIYGHIPGVELGANVLPVATTCGNNYGSASVSSINALGAVSYYWSNGDTTNVVDSLNAGNYYVHVTDSLNCYVNINFTIDNSNGPTIVVDSASNPACGGTTTGFVDVTVTGGTLPYTFLWSNGTTTEDLTSAAPGTYSLIVTDNAGCENQICLTLTAPQQLVVVFSGSSYANCLTNDGAVAVYTYGGYTPYTYQWDAAALSQTNDTAVGLFSGMYSVIVTDSIGCTATGLFGVSDWTGPSPYLFNSANPSCTGVLGFIDMDVFGSGPFSYQWSSGQVSEDIYSIPGGEYLCLVTDLFSCKTVFNYTLYQQVPYSPVICMVTVDSTATQNVVVWDKSMNPEAAYFNIYREGACNSYDFGKVGFTNYDSLSVFYDTVVNTNERSWRYYVTCVDTCGFESYPSEINRSIHATAIFNSSFDVQLQWSAYEGYDVTSYYIYRENPTATGFDLVDSVDAAILNYIDTIDFSAYTELEYFVEAQTDFICFASRAFNQNSARSNHPKAAVIVDSTGSAIHNPLEILEEVKMYPNPSNDLVTINIGGSENQNYHIDILDQLGKMVKSVDFATKTTFTTRELHNGMYFVRLKNSNQAVKTLKLVVSH